MKRTLILLAVLSGVALVAWGQVPLREFDEAASPSATTACLQRPARFVGVTTQTFDGDDGFHAMTTACADEFPGSRMARTEHYFDTNEPPAIAEEAWILPHPLLVIPSNNFPDSAVIDVSGTLVDNAQQLNCISWTRNDADIQGTILDQTGAILKASCSQARSVACAAP